MANTTIAPLDMDLAYPILTEQVDTTSSSPGGQTTGGGELSRVAADTVRDILGWRPRAGDPKGFLAALNASFRPRDVEGHVEVDYTPRSMAVNADLGAVTGGQASLYTRAVAALDQILPIVDGLVPLRTDADPEDCESLRAMVRQSITNMVSELGTPGGPRVPRVDTCFSLLTGYAPNDVSIATVSIENVKGQLSRLGDLFGLAPDQVNTVDEERTLTDFLTLVDHVVALQVSWERLRTAFTGPLASGADSFFGTDLVLLSRFLAAVAESVRDVNFALDSVFLGFAERQTIMIPGTGMSVADLLDWIEHFVVDEAPRIFKDSGKDGVDYAFLPTARKIAKQLRKLWRYEDTSVGKLITDEQIVAEGLPPAFGMTRVRLAFRQLRANLAQVITLASRIRRITDAIALTVTPVPLVPATKLTVSITGDGFTNKHVITLVDPYGTRVPPAARSTTVADSGRILSASFDTSNGEPGIWVVQLADPSGAVIDEFFDYMTGRD